MTLTQQTIDQLTTGKTITTAILHDEATLHLFVIQDAKPGTAAVIIIHATPRGTLDVDLSPTDPYPIRLHCTPDPTTELVEPAPTDSDNVEYEDV